MPIEGIANKLRAYIAAEFLDNDGSELTEDTPLLDLGILDSFRILKLLTFVDRELGVSVPLEQVTIDDMRDIASLSTLVARRAAPPARLQEAAS